MRRALRVAPRSKYSHHISTDERNASKKAISRPDPSGWPDSADPVTTMPSPSAMMMNKAQRSAMWEPEISQFSAVDRPSPGTMKNANGPAYSIASASSHHASRSSGPRRTPIAQNTAEAQNQSEIRMKLRALLGFSRANTAIMQALRPIWIVT